jgi:hypothetical protein
MSLFTLPEIKPITIIILTILFTIIEWLGREQNYAIEHLGLCWNKPFRWVAYLTIILAVFCFAGSEQQFIYFQF